MPTWMPLFTTAVLLGGMVFFAAIMAPLVFTRLPGPQAGPFIRAVFPVYYLFVFINAALATLTLAPRIEAVAMGLVALLTVWLRQWLMPRINRWSDTAQAGDASARRRFNLGHRVSVVVNFAQLLVVGAVLARFA